ncbi:MAG: lipoate--protein ligase [Oscillospiraceae bacterium]|nr:lipoate--protein ligase [Oscillospiraceae bacterium]
MNKTYYLETGSTDPAYNLAFEEYVQTHRRTGNYLILWQNRNAVIIGRNQNAEEEINAAFVKAHGIKVIRRNTGGGAVYHDMGNLNYSFITDAADISQRSAQPFTEPVVRALKALGLDAEASGRNDILIDGRKVSGTAQHLIRGRILHHGTLLFESNPEMIAGALNPDPTKFQSKSIKSVRSRVGNIRSLLRADMMLQAFWDYLKTALTADGIEPTSLSNEELAEIEKLQKEKYDTWDWNFGRSPKYQRKCKKRFGGGSLEISLSVADGCIQDIRILGDFLGLTPVEPLEDALKGCIYREDAVCAVLDTLCLPDMLGGIEKREFLETIFA